MFKKTQVKNLYDFEITLWLLDYDFFIRTPLRFWAVASVGFHIIQNLGGCFFNILQLKI